VTDISSEVTAKPIKRLLSNVNFLAVWSVGGITGVIRWFQLLAFGVYTYETTGSPLLVSTIPILWMLPLTLFGPAIGVLADQVSRKLLLGFSIAIVTLIQIFMAVAAHTGDLSYLLLSVVSFLSGIFWATDMPIRRRLLGDLSQDNVSAAMGLDSATGNATRMLGPLLGGIMLQVVGMFGVFWLSGLLYGICLLLILLSSLPQKTAGSISTAFYRDLLTGISFAASDPLLRRIFFITIIFNVWGFPFTSMIPVIGRDELSLTPFLVGVLSSMEGFGALVGALLITRFAVRNNFFKLYLGGTILYLSGIAYLALLTYVAGGPNHSFNASSIALTVIGIAGACFAAMQGTLTYLAAPPAYRSRMLGVLTLCIGTGPLGFFNVGWLAEIFGVANALAIISVEGLFALSILWIWGAGLNFTEELTKRLAE
tara:strand:+ start:1425 stop:2702 length:1278 start_codon:yes stop_codon:yes gene_type:complete